MPLLLYDNFERRMREFTPLAGNEVGLYTCGPTVYAVEDAGGTVRVFVAGARSGRGQ